MKVDVLDQFFSIVNESEKVRVIKRYVFIILSAIVGFNVINTLLLLYLIYR